MVPTSMLLQAEMKGLATRVRGLSLAVPKRPAGPYAQFVSEEFLKVKKKYPAMNTPAIMKQLGQDWAKVPQGKKESLLSKFEAEKVKYQKQMSLLPPEAMEKAMQEKQDKKVAAASQELKKLLKSLDKPKKPVNDYFLFAEAQRPKLPKGLSPTAAIKRLATEWNALPEAQKAPFEAKRALLKTEHEKAMKIWNTKMEWDGKMEQVSVLQEKLSALKKVEKVDPLAKPKRSPSAILLFQMECKTVPACANLKGAERSKWVTSKWEKMSALKRGPYELRAAEAKAEHDKAMKRWTRKMEKMGPEV
jgi:hypothetical protein